MTDEQVGELISASVKPIIEGAETLLNENKRLRAELEKQKAGNGPEERKIEPKTDEELDAIIDVSGGTHAKRLSGKDPRTEKERYADGILDSIRF